MYNIDTLQRLSLKTIAMMPGINRDILSEISKLIVENPSTSIITNVHANPQKQIYSKKTIHRIKIPTEIGHLPIEVILYFNRGISNLEKPIKSFSHYFSTLNDFSDYKLDDLCNLKGIGVKKSQPIWEWFSNLNLSLTYNELDIHLGNNVNTLDEVHYSNNLKELFIYCGIEEFLEIENITYIDSNNLPFRMQVALLEARTFYYDEDNDRISTRTNQNSKNLNLIADFDDYCANRLSKKEVEFAKERWSNKCVPTFESIANRHGITRERVRQIISQIINNYKCCYIVDYEYLLGSLFNKFYENLSYLEMDDLGENSYKRNYDDTIYINYFSDLFKPLPIGKQITIAFQQNKFTRLRNKIRENTCIPYTYKLDEALNGEILIYKIVILCIILHSNGKYKIVKHNNIYYINRNYYSGNSLAKYIVKNSKDVLSLGQINEEIEKLGGKKQEHLGMLGRLLKEESIYNLDYHIIGTIENFGYPPSEWAKIQNECINIIDSYGHQVHAAFIFKKIRNMFPKIRSKYELIYILRDSREIVDLKHHYFTLIKFRDYNKNPVYKIAKSILNKYQIPIHANVLYNAINNERSYNREGMTTLYKQYDDIIFYQPAFYGLSKNDKYNIKYLSTHIPYIEKYIIWKSSINEDFRFSKLIKDIKYDGNEYDFCNMIMDNSNMLTINTVNENSYEKYLLHKKMSVKKMALVVLATYKRPMMFNELLVILRNTYAINKNYKYTKYLDTYLMNHPRIVVYSNLYEYNPMVAKYDKYSNMLESIVNILKEWVDYISIEELYELIEEEDLRPKNCRLLLGLLRLDDRIEIIDNTLISLNENE